MKSKQKYQLLIGAVLFIFFYLVSTEVLDRYSAILRSYNDLIEKEQSLLSPEELSQKKADLQLQKAALAKGLNAGSRSLDRNQIGVVRFLNETANTAHLRFKSLTPTEDASTGQIKETGFNAEFAATYDKAGAFINNLETGVLPIEIKKIVMEIEKPGSTVLKVSVDGKARFLTRESL